MSRGGPERWVRPLAPGERRLFIAVPLGDHARLAVARLMGGLGAPTEGGRDPDPAAPPAARLRWVRSESLHLTLRFLGATPPAALPALEGRRRPDRVPPRPVRGAPGGRRRLSVAGASAGRLPPGDGRRGIPRGAARPTSPPSSPPLAGHRGSVPSKPISRWRAPTAWREPPRPWPPCRQRPRSLDAAWIVDRVVLFESLIGGGPARYVALHSALLGESTLRDPGAAL